jgi:hypothetical protein
MSGKVWVGGDGWPGKAVALEMGLHVGTLTPHPPFNRPHRPLTLIDRYFGGFGFKTLTCHGKDNCSISTGQATYPACAAARFLPLAGRAGGQGSVRCGLTPSTHPFGVSLPPPHAPRRVHCRCGRCLSESAR